MPIFIAGATLLALVFPAHVQSGHHIQPPRPRHGCSKTFTVKMANRAIDATYSGTRDVTHHNRVMVSWFTHCQRHKRNIPQVKAHLRDAKAAWYLRRHPPFQYALASWYDDAGATASGYHSYYGVAHKSMAFGTKVVFSYHGRQVTATVDDRGPYVGAREWDLNQNTAGALGFDGVGEVGYRIVS